MTDDSLALIACAVAFLASGGLLAVSQPFGKWLRRSRVRGAETRSVAFQVAERPDQADRRAA